MVKLFYKKASTLNRRSRKRKTRETGAAPRLSRPVPRLASPRGKTKGLRQRRGPFVVSKQEREARKSFRRSLFQKAATFRSGQRSHFIVNGPGAAPPLAVCLPKLLPFSDEHVIKASVLKQGELHISHVFHAKAVPARHGQRTGGKGLG